MKAPILVWLLLAALLPISAFAQTPASHPAASRPATAAAAHPAATHAGPATPTPAAPSPVVPPLAKVNGSPISQAHLDQAISNRWAGPIMQALIEDRLIRQEARSRGLKVSPEDVQARFKTVRSKFASEQAFQRHLLAEGLTGPGFIEKLTGDILLEKLLAQQSAVSADEARKYYTDRQAEYRSPAEIHLFTITTGTIEEAYLVRERLAAGEKFETVAKELSQDEAKEQGGDNAWVRASSLPDKALADSLFAMEDGVVSSPLRSGTKYVVALVRERRPEKIISFEQAEKDIVAKLQAERTLSRETYLRVLARKAEIAVDWAPARYLTARYAALRQIQVIVDDEPLELTDPPVRLPNGAIIVPAKPLLQAVGARLDWQASDQALIASTPTGRVKLTVGSLKAIVGLTTLEAKDMPAVPSMRSGTLYISPRVPLAALGATLDWDTVENALVVTTIAKDMPSPTVPPARTGLEKQ